MAPLAPVAVWIGANIGTIGTVAAATGAAVSAYGSIEAGRAQEAAARTQARLAGIQAEEAQRAAKYEAWKERRDTRRLLSRQRSLYLTSGVKLEGTPLEVMAATAYEAELDAQMIERYGRIQGAFYQTEAELERFAGRSARQAGYLRAGTTLLTTGGQMARGL